MGSTLGELLQIIIGVTEFFCQTKIGKEKNVKGKSFEKRTHPFEQQRFEKKKKKKKKKNTQKKNPQKHTRERAFSFFPRASVGRDDDDDASVSGGTSEPPRAWWWWWWQWWFARSWYTLLGCVERGRTRVRMKD